MVDVLQLGPLLIRLSWLYLGISALAAFWVMKAVLKRKSPEDLQIVDVLSNGLIWGILIWKVSPAFTDPSLLAKPFTLIVYPGTALGVRLGMLAALLYTVYSVWKRSIDWKITMDTLTIGWIAASIVFLLSHWQYGTATALPWGISISDPAFRYHPVNVYKLILLAALAWSLRRLVAGQGKVAQHGLVGYGVVSLFVSLFEPKAAVLLELSKAQLIAVITVIAGLAVGIAMQYLNSPKKQSL